MVLASCLHIYFCRFGDQTKMNTKTQATKEIGHIKWSGIGYFGGESTEYSILLSINAVLGDI